MAKKSKASESGQAEESPRGEATAEPKHRCAEVSPTTGLRCEKARGHGDDHETETSRWVTRTLSERGSESPVPPTAEPSITEAPCRSRENQIRLRLDAATPEPWKAYRMVHDERGDALTPEEIGEYVTNTVRKSAILSGSTDFLFISAEKSDGPADVCHVGNGPASPANADFIQHAKDDIAYLLGRLSRPVCAQCGGGLDDDIHYVGTVDSHAFVSTASTEAASEVRGTEGLLVPRGCPTIRVEDIPEIRVTDGSCEMGWIEPNGVRVAVCGPTSASVQAVVDMFQTRQDAKEVVGAVQQQEPLLARIAELEERLARQAASHREVRKRLLRKARGGR